MSFSKAGHSIKKRDNANDVFITPVELCKEHINMIEYKNDDIWYDPFRNTGNYYNNFPNDNKLWSEILDGKDFFEHYEEVDIICSNPPYSMITRVLEKCISLKPRIISLLIGMMNLTPKRVEDLNKAGYGLVKLRMCKVYQWFGNSYIVVFEKGKENCIEIDRKIYK